MPTGAIRKEYDDRNKAQAHELVAKMTREEKACQMVYHAADLASLGIPAYNWWYEALHRVARRQKREAPGEGDAALFRINMNRISICI